MLARIIYSDDDWLMAADWLGLGSLYVKNGKTRVVTRAHPAQKTFVLGVAEALEAAGVPVEPNNETARGFFRSLAEDIGTFSVESIEWASLFRMGPQRFVSRLMAVENGAKHDA